MRSSNRDKVQPDIGRLRAAALEEYAFVLGRLDALIYELSSPFGRPIGRRPWL